MATNGRMAAGWGSAAVNLVLLLAISASAVGYGRPSGYRIAASMHGGPWHVPVDLWQPFISNPEHGEAGPRCPAPPPPGARFQVADAPLPEGFSSWQRGRGAAFACVRLDAEGNVEAVRLLGRPVDRPAELVRTIRSWWHFRPLGSGQAETGWQRVRLTRSGWAHEQL